MKWIICLAIVLIADSLKLETQGARELSELAINNKLDQGRGVFKNLGRQFLKSAISSATGAAVGAGVGSAPFSTNVSRGAVAGLAGAAVGSIVDNAAFLVFPVYNVKGNNGVNQALIEGYDRSSSRSENLEQSPTQIEGEPGVNSETGQLCEVNSKASAESLPNAAFMRHAFLRAGPDDYCRPSDNKCLKKIMFAYFATSSSTNKQDIDAVGTFIDNLGETQNKERHLTLIKAANVMFITYISLDLTMKLLASSRLDGAKPHPFSLWLDDIPAERNLACIYFLGSIHSLIVFNNELKAPRKVPTAPDSQYQGGLIRQQLVAGIRFFDLRLTGNTLQGYDPTSLVQKWGTYNWGKFWDELERWCFTAKQKKKKTPIFIRFEPKTKGADDVFKDWMNDITKPEMRKHDEDDIKPSSKVGKLMNTDRGKWIHTCRIVFLRSNWYSTTGLPPNYWDHVSGYPTPRLPETSQVMSNGLVLDTQEESLDLLKNKNCGLDHEQFTMKFMKLKQVEYKDRLKKRIHKYKTTESPEFW